MVCFIDDILLGGDTKFPETVSKLRQNFQIGAELTQTFDITGIHLEENNDLSITIHQPEYIDSINEIHLSATFRRGNKQFTHKKKILFRKALGKINWVAGMARPEINYHIGKIGAKVKNGTPADVHTIKNMPLHITVPVLDSSSPEYNYTLMQVLITCQMAEVKEVCNILM